MEMFANLSLVVAVGLFDDASVEDIIYTTCIVFETSQSVAQTPLAEPLMQTL